jgi:SAM-dependent methyltransferase
MESSTGNFEFDALSEAVHYRRGLLQEFQACLLGDVLEVGAGIGQMTEELVRLPGVKKIHAVEPDAGFFDLLTKRRLPIESTHGTVEDVPPDNCYDALFSVNVLEHIEDDEGELKRYHGRLKPGASLCLFVPACPSIYAPIDRMFGHHRRYTRKVLRGRLEDAGFAIQALHYYNAPGYLAWWWNFCVLKKMVFERNKVRFFDRAIFPLAHGWEYHVMRPPVGQSLMAVARA